MVKIFLCYPVFFVLIGIATTALAQILLKKGSSFDILGSKWLVYLSMSLFAYSISFLSYYLALQHYDISKISPIMMASIVSIVALYGFFVGEHFNLSKLSGIILAVISVYLISKS